MPYASTITTARREVHGEWYTVVTITETGNTGTSDEAQITGIPAIGTVTKVLTTLTLGSGATATQVDPQIGERTGTATVYENATAGTAPVSGTLAAVYYAAANVLYWRAKADGTLGTGGQIVSVIVIKDGHHP